MVEDLKNVSMFPSLVNNWIGGVECPAESREVFEKVSPHSGKLQCSAARSRKEDIDAAISAAMSVQPSWADMPASQRGNILHQVCNLLEKHQDEMAHIVALETGKSHREAFGETGGAIALGRFFAGEGQRLYGRTTTSGVKNKYAMTVRQPCGIAALIIAANTPIANVAWKAFPALICGNAAVLKAAEDTPATAWYFASIASAAGLPAGVLNVVQGTGQEAGVPLVEHPEVDVISFTGSTRVGKWIAEAAARRLAKVSLELGGKNPLIVCDDADLDKAVEWVCLSAFSNAGQRCASGSRIIIFEEIYVEFRDRLARAASALKLGPTDEDDLGPVINERQLNNMLSAIESAKNRGATILCGGERSTEPGLENGFYLKPTILENVEQNDEITTCELFGPIAALYKARDYKEALRLANDSPYGLTACIHTKNYHRAIDFSNKVRSGVAVVNAGTYGSEPHMPFGGLRQSGNGSREPGTEALDVYSELKDIYMIVEPEML